jgi:Na+-transporting NADH:ubiquinone oxidoreductase subunit C
MSDNLKSIVFAVVLCLVCSLLLTLASSGLSGYQQRNVAVDRQKNLLKSVGLVSAEQRYAPEEIESLYRESIKMIWVNTEGVIVTQDQHTLQDLPLYLYVKEDNVEAYIVPIDTRGLWGKIYGYMAIEKDGSTISGFTVYQHGETPGLGGEIEKLWFQKNFVGKRIVNREGDFVSISVARGKVAERVRPELQTNYVDGISGATLTGKYLSAGFKEILSIYEPVSVRFRKNESKKWPSDKSE